MTLHRKNEFPDHNNLEEIVMMETRVSILN